MKNTIKLTTAIFLFTFAFLAQTDAQSKQSTSNFSISFEGEMDLDLGGNFEVNLYNGLTKQLVKDGLVKSEDNYHFVLKNEEIKVDGKRLSGRDFYKYQDIIRDDIESIRFFEIKWEKGSLTTLRIKTNK